MKDTRVVLRDDASRRWLMEETRAEAIVLDAIPAAAAHRVVDDIDGAALTLALESIAAIADDAANDPVEAP